MRNRANGNGRENCRIKQIRYTCERPTSAAILLFIVFLRLKNNLGFGWLTAINFDKRGSCYQKLLKLLTNLERQLLTKDQLLVLRSRYVKNYSVAKRILAMTCGQCGRFFGSVHYAVDYRCRKTAEDLWVRKLIGERFQDNTTFQSLSGLPGSCSHLRIT